MLSISLSQNVRRWNLKKTSWALNSDYNCNFLSRARSKGLETEIQVPPKGNLSFDPKIRPENKTKCIKKHIKTVVSLRRIWTKLGKLFLQAPRSFLCSSGTSETTRNPPRTYFIETITNVQNKSLDIPLRPL